MACKPVWSEGVLVTQHHFQQQDRYHEQLLAERLRAALHYAWGISELEVDLSALATRQLKLVRIRAIWPDGASVHCGGACDSPCPAPRSFDAVFSPTLRTLPVFIGLAEDVATRPLLSSPSDEQAVRRYQQALRLVRDTNDALSDAEVEWASPNLRIFFGDEPQHGYSTIRIAEIVRDGAGNAILRDTFVAPVSSLGASSFLLGGLQRVLGAAIARQRDLVSECARRDAGRREFHVSTAQRFWFLHSLNGAIPGLRHLLETMHAHPEELYLSLATFAGQLASFSDGADPASLPKFDYLALGDVFEELFARLLTLLSADLQAPYVQIPLERRSDGMYLGRLTGASEREFFLAVKSSMADALLRERAPRIVKVADWSQVYDVVKQARHGVRAEVEWQPSAALPLEPGTCFLRLRKEGPFWKAIEKSGTIALYVPSEGEWSDAGISLYSIDPKDLT